MGLIVSLKNTDTSIRTVISMLEQREGQYVGLQLTQPKLQNKQQKAPETTNQACRPPSGKEEGSKPAKAGFASRLAFSTSESGWSDVSGRILASVFWGSPLLDSEVECERRWGGRCCFSLTV